MQVSTSDLRTLTEQLISHLEKKGYHSIEVSSDYYWNIAQETRYDPYQEPLEFDLGQLTDDWAELQKILLGDSPTIGYALVWLSSILRYIGETVND